MLDEGVAVLDLAILSVHSWNRSSELVITFVRRVQAHRRDSVVYFALSERDVYTVRDIRSAYVSLG